MKFIGFPLLISEEFVYDSRYMSDSFLYIQIIKRRIDKQNSRYFKYKDINPRKQGHAKRKLSLDIKTMFIFSKIYLDYLARYISETFFQDISNLKKGSYHQHINSLVHVNTDNNLFNDYKKYMLRNGLKLVYRVGFIRDKLIAHRLLNRFEYILVDSANKKIGLSIERVQKIKLLNDLKNPKIDERLKKDISTLAQNYNIPIHEQNEKKMRDFDYLDLILTKIEESAPDCPINGYIGLLRQRLGVILDSDEVFVQIYEFTMGLKDLFKCPDILLIDLPDEF